VEERVDEPGVEAQVGGEREIAAHRMVGGEQRDRLLHGEERRLVLHEADVSEDRLHDLHADPAVAGVEHERDHAVALQAPGERPHAGLGRSHVVEHAGGDDEVVLAGERGDLLDRQPVELEVVERVLLLQKAVMVERRGAHVDRDDPRATVREGEDGRLAGATASHEDVEIAPGPTVGPEHPVGVARIEPLPAAGEPGGQIDDRLGVHPFFVLARDDVGERIGGHDATGSRE